MNQTKIIAIPQRQSVFPQSESDPLSLAALEVLKTSYQILQGSADVTRAKDEIQKTLVNSLEKLSLSTKLSAKDLSKTAETLCDKLKSITPSSNLQTVDPNLAIVISTIKELVGKKPKNFNLPPRNPLFTGREKELTLIQETLQQTQVFAITAKPSDKSNDSSQQEAVVGLGGVGKTQLALEYAHRHLASHNVVAWIHTSQESTTIYSAYRKLFPAYAGMNSKSQS